MIPTKTMWAAVSAVLGLLIYEHLQGVPLESLAPAAITVTITAILAQALS